MCLKLYSLQYNWDLIGQILEVSEQDPQVQNLINDDLLLKCSKLPLLFSDVRLVKCNDCATISVEHGSRKSSF